MSYLSPALLSQRCYSDAFWFTGEWGTLAGVMVSVTLARGMESTIYCSKGAGSHRHGSSNLGGPQWMGLNVLALCDNYAVVQAINARRAKDRDIMRLLCLFVPFFFSVHFKFTLSSAHVQGAKNSIADAFSCNRLLLRSIKSQWLSPHPSGSLCWTTGQTGHPSAGGSGSALF